MAEDTSTQDGNEPTEPTSGGGDEFVPITTQDELNARLGARLERERAKFSDYPDLQAKAAEYDEVVSARDAAVEARDVQAVEALRWRVAATKGIDPEDVELFLTGTDEDTLTKQAERLAERVQTPGNRVPGEGTTPTTPKPSEDTEFVRGLFGNTGD